MEKGGETMRIGIIGAGASGMAAALAASEQPDNQVIVWERQQKVGRKLLATGNGRCNLTNLHAPGTGYHGEDPAFAKKIVERFPPEKTLYAFQEIGLYTVAEPSGRVYPYSDQANSVVDVLRFALEKPNITVELGFEVEKVKKASAGFLVFSREETLSVDRLIAACGGLAGTKLGGTMSGYKLLRSLGHSCTRLRPALVQLQSDWPYCPSLKGVRANCSAAILKDGAVFAKSGGEVQFTQYGLSGPVIFEISRDACQGTGAWVCRLDLLPERSEEAVCAALSRRENLPVSELFTGILHNRLGRVVAQSAGLRLGDRIGSLPPDALRLAASRAKALDIPLTGPLGMDSAQVTAGGIVTAEFDSRTLESRRVPGLYACGEVLDVDGDCGGYNLQWAWSSGWLAGRSAGGEKP